MNCHQLNKILEARKHLDQLLDQEQEQEVEASIWRSLAVAQDEMLKNLLESLRYKDDHVDMLLRLEEYKVRVFKQYPGAACTTEQQDTIGDGQGTSTVYIVKTGAGVALGYRDDEYVGEYSEYDAWKRAASRLPMPR